MLISSTNWYISWNFENFEMPCFFTHSINILKFKFLSGMAKSVDTRITWGYYLSNGIVPTPYENLEGAFSYSDTYDPVRSKTFCSRLQTHGYAILVFDQSSFSLKSFEDWENVFQSAFDSTNEYKNKLLQYSTIKGVTVGYRNDNNREFIETRVCANKRTLPIINVNRFEDVVHNMYTRLSVVSQQILSCICEYLGVDDEYLVNLVDRGTLTGEDLSSSVIRICRYPADDAQGSRVSFGAHTDTSFLTLAPFSSVPGKSTISTT